MPIPRVPEPEVMDSAEEAAAYDAMDHGAVNAAFAEDFLAFAGTPGEVLDLGCGTGWIPVEIARRCDAGVVALDASAEMLVVAGRNAGPFGGRVRLLLASASKLPFADRSVGAVVSNSLVHHLHDPLPALREVARVLRPGGVVFIRDLYRPDTPAEVDRLVDRYTAGETPLARHLFAISLPASFTVDEVRELAAAAGLDAKVAMTSDRHWTLTAGPQ